MCRILAPSHIFECFYSLKTSLILGEACPILLMTIIYLIIKGASISLTPNPHIIKNGNQGIAVAPYNFIMYTYSDDYWLCLQMWW